MIASSFPIDVASVIYKALKNLSNVHHRQYHLYIKSDTFYDTIGFDVILEILIKSQRERRALKTYNFCLFGIYCEKSSYGMQRRFVSGKCVFERVRYLCLVANNEK